MSELDEQARVDRVKVGHLVTGLVFLGVALTWALHAAGVVDDLQTGVVLPVVLVAAGVIGLVAMVAQGRRGRTPARDTDQVHSDADDTEDTLVIEEENKS